MEAIQADCDIKATNNHSLRKLPTRGRRHWLAIIKSSRTFGKGIQLLMQDLDIDKHERSVKHYDEFQQLLIKETLCDFYLRFSLLLNDMNIHNMKPEQFQVKTKFLNTLPPEWSKFVTDVKLTRKGKIRTGKLDFEDVYFVKELKFNLFSVSQMCDKKNSVLFTETECLVLSPDFKLLDESQVLLKVPRQNNMYSFDLKNVVPSGGLTCLFAKATIDESNLWHRRLGHINFKTMNKLVKGNLVRGLPSKLFENDHTCVVCQKGKKHKASCLVGFDNGTEFKNNDMNQFCGMKGIKREFSVAKTLQQNGVAKRKNKTLIEAARTMLTDSLLPTTFWAEAVSTACYVQNRVLVTKPYNKTPYELLHSRPPSISFMRPFGCLVTILNTLDPLVQRADDDGKKTNEKPVNEGERNGQEKEGRALNKEDDQNVQDFKAALDNLLVQQKEGYSNSTNKDSTVSPSVSTAEQSFTNVNDLPTDPIMPDLEDTANLLNTVIFSGAYDNKDVGAEADLNNLETTMNVSPIRTNRIHKDHPKDQIIRDINLATQTRRMTKISEELAMRLVDLPKGNHAIRTKWVYRNKKDERGIVVRNKARLVAQGYPLEEGIDYDEVFAPVARIEAIRLFLAYASFMGFIMYQMDGKSAFLYGTIEEEKFDFVTMKTASTLIETHKALLKNEEAEDLDVHLYRLMIGSLMYLTASRPDTVLVQGLWYPRDSPFDLEAFSDSDYAGSSTDRKSTTGGLTFWLLALDYLISEDVFVRLMINMIWRLRILSTWTCNIKQKCVKSQIQKRGQDTKIPQFSDPPKKVGDEAIHKKLGDIIERVATTASSLEAKQDSGSSPRCQDTILGGAEAQTRFKAASKQSNDPPLLRRVNDTRIGEDIMKLRIGWNFCTKCLERALDLCDIKTKRVNCTSENGEIEITATIDRRVKTVTEASIRRHLMLEDSDEVYTAEPDISTANVPVSTAGAEVSTVSPKVKTAAESLVYIRRSATKRKDKGKAIMKESEPVQEKTKLQLEQERLGYEEALRLQEQLDEEERQRIAIVHEEANTFNVEE
ncbi:ribonuclease H-like domain-containing protein [Tanacetum coccineum]